MDPSAMMASMGMDPSVMSSMMSGMDPSMMGGMDPSMMGGMAGYQAYEPTIEEQILEAKPMLKNPDKTTFKFIDTHCHIDLMFKKENYNGDFKTYRLDDTL